MTVLEKPDFIFLFLSEERDTGRVSLVRVKLADLDLNDGLHDLLIGVADKLGNMSILGEYYTEIARTENELMYLALEHLAVACIVILGYGGKSCNVVVAKALTACYAVVNVKELSVSLELTGSAVLVLVKVGAKSTGNTCSEIRAGDTLFRHIVGVKGLEELKGLFEVRVNRVILLCVFNITEYH